MDKQNKDKELSQKDLIDVCTRLKDLGYVNDLLYSKQIVEYYKQTKGISYIERFLREKLVDQDIIDEALLAYDSYEEMENAIKIASKYSLLNRKYPLKKQQALIMQKLSRDGFSSRSISSSINKIELVDESDDTLDRDILKQIKKYEGKDISSYEKKQKIISSLMNKGYSYSKIIEKLKL